MILVKGIRESAAFNALMVVIKLAVVLFVIAIGAFYIDPANWQPFAPYGYSGISFFGNTIMGQHGPGGEPLGMLAGAAISLLRVHRLRLGLDPRRRSEQSEPRRADRHHRSRSSYARFFTSPSPRS